MKLCCDRWEWKITTSAMEHNKDPKLRTNELAPSPNSPKTAQATTLHISHSIDRVLNCQHNMAQAIFSGLFGGSKPSASPVPAGDSGKELCASNRTTANHRVSRFRRLRRSSRPISSLLLCRLRYTKLLWLWFCSNWRHRGSLYEMVQHS